MSRFRLGLVHTLYRLSLVKFMCPEACLLILFFCVVYVKMK